MSIWPALRDPINNIEILRQYFEDRTLLETSLQIHTHGDTYVDSVNTLLYNGSKTIHKSGLYRLGEFQPVRSDIDYGHIAAGDKVRISVIEPYTEDDIRAIYNGSRIQPQNYGPFRNADEFIAANNTNILTSTLFHMMREADVTRPFIFYNFACRTVCGSFDPEIQGLSLARRVRNLSANMLHDRMHIRNVKAQLVSADMVLHSGAAHVNLTAWIARKRATEDDRRIHFSVRAVHNASRSRSRRKSYRTYKIHASSSRRSLPRAKPGLRGRKDWKTLTRVIRGPRNR